MAQRRMFSPDIVESEEFLDMPHSSQSLYFHLSMRADDDGFVQPKIVMRMIGANTDDLKILLGKRFLLSFQSGVVVVKHWLVHNLIRADLYKPTRHSEEKKMIGVKDNGSYTEMRDDVAPLKEPETPEWLKKRRGELRTANVPQTVPRIGKDRLGKDRIGKSNQPNGFDEFWVKYPKKVGKGAAEKSWVKLTPPLDDVLTAIEKQKQTDQWSKDSGKFIPNPATWLNQRRWEDEVTITNQSNKYSKYDS